MRNTRVILYQLISASFCVIVIISNILSMKMTMLPWLNLPIPAGLITYPLTFLLGDLVTEIFGAKWARLMIYLALAMNLLSLVIIQLGLLLPASSFEEERAFQTVLGLSSLRIFSSLASYIASQLADVQLYAAIKHWTRSKWLWLRNNGSTCISQLIDTLLMDLLFLGWGLGMSMGEIFPIMVFSYAYKTFFSFASTPLFYLLVFLIRNRWQVMRTFYPQSIQPKGTL